MLNKIAALLAQKRGRDFGHSTGALSRRDVNITLPSPIWLMSQVHLFSANTEPAFQPFLSPQGISYETREVS